METISKHIGEGFGRGELYAALAYDSSDVFGGMKIKNVMFNSTGKAYFRDSGLYIYSSADGQLDIVADTLLKFSTPINVGADDTGHDVKLFGATSGKYWLWDESADGVVLVGTFTETGNMQITGTLTVGVDDTGHDVKFFGATAGAYMLWDESADELVFATGASIDITADKVMIDFQDGDASAIDPSATAESGWINVNVGGVKKYIPYYAAA